MEGEDAQLATRLGQELKKRRTARGWSQAALAERVGVSTDYVSLLERGERLPAVNVLVRLAFALGASTDELLGLEQAYDAWIHDAGVALKSVPAEGRPWVLAMLHGVAQRLLGGHRPPGRELGRDRRG